MKPIVWIILSILVVAAIVFTVVARKGASTTGKRKMDTEDYVKFADKMDKRITRLEERTAKLIEKGITPTAQPMLDQFNAKINELKTVVSDLRTTPSEENMQKVQQLYKEIKTLFRNLGGTGAEEEGEE